MFALDNCGDRISTTIEFNFLSAVQILGKPPWCTVASAPVLVQPHTAAPFPIPTTASLHSCPFTTWLNPPCNLPAQTFYSDQFTTPLRNFSISGYAKTGT